ncbi:unnamed protein product [Blepharisma stoltei]|uniref:Phosphodiesterase n=1 Tax=Blepharisma stoltei TaxID=1481888 RepID=A0AAU9J1K3_9CILI|nr:unnamed protein product [Blepharisma stoltei]
MTKIGIGRTTTQEGYPLSATDMPLKDELLSQITIGRFLKFSNDSIEMMYQNLIVNWNRYPEKITKSFKQDLRLYLYSYYLLSIVYLILYIVATSDHDSGNISACTIGLMAGHMLFSTIMYFLSFYTDLFRSLRASALILTYLIIAAILIINNQPIQELIFDEKMDHYMSCMLGLLILLSVSSSIIHTNLSWFFIINSLIAIFYLIIHLCSDQSISTTFFEFSIYISRVFIESKKFYLHEIISREKFLAFKRNGEDHISSSEPQTEIEEIMGYLKESIECTKLLSQSVIPTRSKIGRVQELLNKVIDIIRSKSNIYKVSIDAITKNLDEDDRVFIKETTNDSQPIAKLRSKIKIRKTDEIITIHKAYNTDELIGVLKQIGKNWNFDMFFVRECTQNQPLSTMGRYCIKKYTLDETLNINDEVFMNYFYELEMRYKDNPYHNSTHAADVLASAMFMINRSLLADLLSDFDLLATIIASLGHDVAHPGFTNRFLINNKDILAINYNDYSVLEMMHCSTTFQIMQEDHSNILVSLDFDHYLAVRKLIIEMILSTDMSKHWDFLAQFKAKTLTGPKNIDKLEQRVDVLKLVIKSADVGHAAKTRDLHLKWSRLVCEEFFAQGDIEKSKNQQVSMYCDRETTDIPKSQAGFIRNIVLPLYEVLAGYFASPYIDESCLEQVKVNLLTWEYEMGRNRVKTLTQPGESIGDTDNMAAETPRYRRVGTQIMKIDPDTISWLQKKYQAS